MSERPLPKIVSLYASSTIKIGETIKKSNFKDNYDSNMEIDLDAMLYVLVDYIAHNSHNEYIIDELNSYISYWNNENDCAHLKPRIEFYSKIVSKSIKIRGECLAFDIPTNIKRNPLIICSIAFCDILKNPLLLSNYSKAPVMLIGFDKDLDYINHIVLPIIDIVLKFVGDVMEICKEEQKQEKETQPKTNTWICYKCRNEISSYPCKYCSEQESEKYNTIKPQKTHIFDKICEWFKILTHL